MEMKDVGIIFVFAVVLTGCTARMRYESSNAMPPLPGDYVQRQSNLSSLEKFRKARETRLAVAWTCPPVPDAAQYVTGIEASPDLRSWAEVVHLPYAITNYVLLTNSQIRCYYRTFNAIKQ